LANVDFGEVIGVTLALDHRQLGPVQMHLDYTWQDAQGNSSDPYETATRARNNDDPRPRVIPLNWDQEHTFNLSLSMHNPKVYSASAILRVASGQPYTPQIAADADLATNSGRKPYGLLLDLRGERLFSVGRRRMSVFGRVFNALDSRYFNGAVFESTGSPYYSRFPGADEVALQDPFRFYEPRRIEVGLTLTSR
jgi:hypothetical protein